MILGLGFALVSALGTNLSLLFKARGAVLARPIQVSHPLRSAADLFRQRWFAIGWILALFAGSCTSKRWRSPRSRACRQS
jgi:hypothetical protein